MPTIYGDDADYLWRRCRLSMATMPTIYGDDADYSGFHNYEEQIFWQPLTTSRPCSKAVLNNSETRYIYADDAD